MQRLEEKGGGTRRMGTAFRNEVVRRAMDVEDSALQGTVMMLAGQLSTGALTQEAIDKAVERCPFYSTYEEQTVHSLLSEARNQAQYALPMMN